MDGKVFFWELTTLIDVMLLGHCIEMRSAMRASRALEELATLMPSEAHKLLDDGRPRVVKLGEKIPADGVVLEGQTSVSTMIVAVNARLLKVEDRVTEEI